MHAPGDVRVEDREDPTIIEPTDAIVRLTATCICGSDLWPYRGIEPVDHTPMGHEYVGVVEEIGSEVKIIAIGDFVVGTQAHKARIPCADGTLAAKQLGGPAPVRRYLPHLIRLIWDRAIDPGKVFDLTLPLEDAAEGHRAMAERRATKVLLTLDRTRHGSSLPGPATRPPRLLHRLSEGSE